MDKPSLTVKNDNNEVKPIQRLKLFLKSGHTIEVVCEKWEFKYNHTTDEYIAYHFEGLKSPKRLSLVLNQIAGYIVE
jgi:hypothetical protein